MSEDAHYLTLTMARIQEDQENWSQAADIYRHLLKNDPGDENLQTGLMRAESKISPADGPDSEALVHDFEQWLEMILRQKKISQLKRLQAHLKA